jgi:methionyl-tRNA formyltransferase
MPKLRVVFLGSDPIALPLLEWLAEPDSPAEIVALLTQPDRPAGRGQRVTPNGIKEWALARGLKVLQPVKLTGEFRQEYAGLGAELALVMAYGHILRDDFIAVPRMGTINFHASLLPKLRGASPIQTAVASGETETGVSLMRIVRKLDAGPVADVEAVRIEKHDTALEVGARLGAACVPLLERNLAALAEGRLDFVPQDESGVTYCRKLVKADGVLDFAAPAAALAARVNGLYPWPGCVFPLDGQVVKAGLAEVAGMTEEGPPVAAPGTILSATGAGVDLATGHGVLRLLRLQRPGGRMLPVGDFLRGFPVTPGEIVPSVSMLPLVDREPFKG